MAARSSSLLKQVRARDVPPAAPDPNRRWVYLATTTSDVADERDRIKRELLERGHVVLPDAPLPMLSRDVETWCATASPSAPSPSICWAGVTG